MLVLVPSHDVPNTTSAPAVPAQPKHNPQMITEREYQSLKADHENARAEAERAHGALDQLMTTLKTKFKCKNIPEAEALLEDLSRSQQKAELQLEKSLKAYQEKWKTNK